MNMENASPVRVLRSRVLVFSVPVRRKKENSVLYLGHQRRGLFTDEQDVWKITHGPDVYEEIKGFEPGTKFILQDGFELEPTNIDLWPKYKDDPRFAELKAFAENVDGDVVTQLVTDYALLAVYEP